MITLIINIVIWYLVYGGFVAFSYHLQSGARKRKYSIKGHVFWIYYLCEDLKTAWKKVGETTIKMEN